MKNLFKIFKTSGSKGLSLTLTFVVLFAGFLVVNAPPVSAQQQGPVPKTGTAMRTDVFPNGNRSETFYKDGNAVKSDVRYPDGSLGATLHYKDGKVTTRDTFHFDGRLDSTMTIYRDNKGNPIKKDLFRPDGSRREVQHFGKSGRMSSSEHYDRDGDLIETETYDKDEGAYRALESAAETLLRRSGNLKEDADGKPDKTNPPDVDNVIDREADAQDAIDAGQLDNLVSDLLQTHGGGFFRPGRDKSKAYHLVVMGILEHDEDPSKWVGTLGEKWAFILFGSDPDSITSNTEDTLTEAAGGTTSTASTASSTTTVEQTTSEAETTTSTETTTVVQCTEDPNFYTTGPSGGCVMK